MFMKQIILAFTKHHQRDLEHSFVQFDEVDPFSVHRSFPTAGPSRGPRLFSLFNPITEINVLD